MHPFFPHCSIIGFKKLDTYKSFFINMLVMFGLILSTLGKKDIETIFLRSCGHTLL